MPDSAPGNLRRDLVENKIRQTALRLFAERGYGNTNLQDIADDIGVSRSAIYYYIPNKEELLGQIVEEHIQLAYSVELATDQFEAGSGLEKLRYHVWLGVCETVARPYSFLAVDRNMGALPDSLRSKLHEAQRLVYEYVCGLIRRGIEDRSIRPVDDRTVAHIIIGVITSTAWWLNRENNSAHRQTADEIAYMVVSFLCADEPAGDGIRGTLARLRAGLDELERAVDSQADDTT
jgi:AcrR family transcriptional regulator